MVQESKKNEPLHPITAIKQLATMPTNNTPRKQARKASAGWRGLAHLVSEQASLDRPLYFSGRRGIVTTQARGKGWYMEQCQHFYITTLPFELVVPHKQAEATNLDMWYLESGPFELVSSHEKHGVKIRGNTFMRVDATPPVYLVTTPTMIRERKLGGVVSGAEASSITDGNTFFLFVISEYTCTHHFLTAWRQHKNGGSVTTWTGPKRRFPLPGNPLPDPTNKL